MSANAIGATPDSTPLHDLGDADLLDRVRHGDDDAFVVLWRRHLPSAQAVANRFRGRIAPEDLVAEASARILRLLREGAGPRDNFRAYFASTVRTVGVDAVRRDMSALPTDAADLDAVAGADTDDAPAEELGSDIVREAFARLPERERQLLWMTMVDGAAPRAVAPRLGVSANLVSVRVMRAKEALRGHYLDVWVQQRSTGCTSPECRWTLEHLSAHVRGRSTPRRHAKVEAHLASCPRDAALADNLRRISTGFAGLVLPFLVAGASQALGAGAGHGAAGLLTAGGATGLGVGASGATGAGATGAAGAGAGAVGAGAASGASGVVGGAVGASGVGGAAGASAATVAASTAATTTAASTAGAAAAAGTSAGAVGSGVAASGVAASGVAASGAAASGVAASGAAASGVAASGAVASGAVASGAVVSGAALGGAAALVPVAVAAGGATIGGLTITPPVATAVAGLVIGLGVAPAVALSHDPGEKHSVVHQLPSTSATAAAGRVRAVVSPSALPDLGSVVGGAVGTVGVAPVVSASAPSSLAATPVPTATATAAPAPAPSATPPAPERPQPDPPAASVPVDPPSQPAPAPSASPPAPEPSSPAPAEAAKPDDGAGAGQSAPVGAPAPGGSTDADVSVGSGGAAAPAAGG